MLMAAALATVLVTSEAAPSPPPAIQTALLSIGFVQLKLSDIRNSPEYARRLSDPEGFLAVSGDFKGDGVQDQAGILRNAQRGVAYIVVSIIREKADTYVVKQMSLAQADDTGLKVACSAGIKSCGLTVFSLSTSKAETFDLVGNDFVRRVPG